VRPLFLKEEDVRQLASVAEVIGVLEAAFQDQSRGEAFTNPRQRLRLPSATLHILSGALPGYFGYKAYVTSPTGAKFLFYLYDGAATELISIMEADTLGQLRTGAASGMATRLLSNPHSSELALFGAGWQAESQLEAIAAVRPLRRVSIVNRSSNRLESFIKKMQPRISAELVGVSSAENAVRESHIITTITSSRDPIVKGDWLQPGQHINAAGGNSLLRRELDDVAVLRADLVVVDSIDQAKTEAGEFVGAIESGRKRWQDFIELRQLYGESKGRKNADQITFFKSLGIALEDVAIGKFVYERAVAQGAGRRLDV
jgi:alanine dehydrogenase